MSMENKALSTENKALSTTDEQQLPQWAFAAALASLPLQTHHRLRRLLAQHCAAEAWERLQTGQHRDERLSDNVLAAWQSTDASSPQIMYETCSEKNIKVVTLDDSNYPLCLRDDPSAPAVLFYKGNLQHFAARRVAIVGTRRATRRGKYFASQLAAQLSHHGVSVVSGLARGIDAAAHDGIRALQHNMNGAPVAVVASGIDVVYPREHALLWNFVAEYGVMVSEAAPGTRPEAHLFPLRNRILAGVSEIVVVVESAVAGGSMITVREAEKRGRQVMAVPGAPQDHASVGTNALLREGCAPVTDVDDVLVALSMDHRNEDKFFDTRVEPSASEQQVLDYLTKGSNTVESIAHALQHDVLEVAVLLGRLESAGWVAHERGWWEALVSPHQQR